MFWAGDENSQWTTIDHADCLWESFRSSDQLQRRRGGRTWTCYSVERRLDNVWRTVVDYERRHSRPPCRSRTGTAELSDTGNETSWYRAWTWPAVARWANEVRCGECQSVRGRTFVFRRRHGVENPLQFAENGWAVLCPWRQSVHFICSETVHYSSLKFNKN